MTPSRFAILLIAAMPAFGNVVFPIEVDSDSSSTSTTVTISRGRDRKAREEALYDRASEALDDHDWQRAANLFRSVANQRLEHADAALYWFAYAQNKRGLRDEALTAITELMSSYPKSRWKEDAKTLELEIRQSSGQRIEVRNLPDDEAKLIVLSTLMDEDPAAAVTVGEEILRSTELPKVKDKVLFVFTQSGDPRAISIVSKTAKDVRSPDLQRRAVRYLGMVGGAATKKALSEVYATTKDLVVRRAVMKAYLVSGDRDELLALAKSEPNVDLRADAVIGLGALGARNELVALYANESAIQIRKRIIQAMFVGGNTEKLMEIAKTEKNPELRATAIRSVGLAGGRASSIASLYDNETDGNVRRTIIDSLYTVGATKQLRDIAQKEKDPSIREEVERKLKLME